MHYYKENPGDTAMIVGRMPRLHRSIFRELKDHYFHAEAALPNNPLKLRELADARSRREREALQRVLDECFLLGDDDRWHLPAWDVQIAEYHREQASKGERLERVDKGASNRRVRLYRAERRGYEDALITDIGRQKAELEALGMADLRALAVQLLGQERVDEIAARAAAAVSEPGAVTPAVTPVKRPEISPHKPEAITQKPPHTEQLTGETVGVGGGETKTETAGVTQPETALPGNAVQVMADALTAAGVPAHYSHEGLQDLVVKGWSASAVLALAPRSWDGIQHRLAWLLAKVANQKAPPVGVAPEQQSGGWPSTRSGVEVIGEQHGLGRWDEAAFYRGRGESFPQYEARVKAHATAEAVS